MLLALLILLQPQPPTPAKPQSVLWSYRSGQDFYVEETQRQFLQIKGGVTATSYLDYSCLWHYAIKAESDAGLQLQASLLRLRVNNPNEAGARAVEKFNLKEGTQSNWLLKKENAGWTIHRAPGDAGRHAPPYFLTFGTPKLDQALDGWKQSWKMPVANWGQVALELTVTLRPQTSDFLPVSTKGRFLWSADEGKDVQVTVMPTNNSIAGLGAFDPTRNRWSFVEWRADGNWQVTRAGVTCTMKHDLYCYFRFYERRPTFP